MHSFQIEMVYKPKVGNPKRQKWALQKIEIGRSHNED